MNKAEFTKVMAYLAVALNKPISPEASEVYWDLLGDLPVEALQTAAKRVVLEHKWATFPSVAELREAATETVRGEVKEMAPSEAWALAWAAAGKIDPEIESTVHKHLGALPPLVAEAMRTFGLSAMCYGKEPVGVVRAQFVEVFKQLQARDRRKSLLPSAVKESIARIGQRPADVLALTGGIGKGIGEKS